jgi:hypothetical protein
MKTLPSSFHYAAASHFIPLVKAFRYRFTCEVAAYQREDVLLFTAHLTVLK